MNASKYWYVGMYITCRGFVRQSTRCEKLVDARIFASEWYEDRIVEKRTMRTAVFWINALTGWLGFVWLILLIYVTFSNRYPPISDERRGFS